MNQRISAACQQTIGLLERFSREQSHELVLLAKRLAALFAEGGHLLIAGNGVLQPVAQQLASQFAFRLSFDRPVLPAVCLGSDAILNGQMLAAEEYGQHLVRHYRAIASEQHLLLLYNDGSDALALKNLCEEVVENEQGIALISYDCLKDPLKSVDIDICLNLATTSTPRQLELSQFAGHILCELVEAELFGR
ncbi:D-sedoheptulose 7-phosphate isomerase [Desulfuromusa kysingii]|uniref:D-sedoheptulose 7-phosphate isomerase n=1 Tax=Desulfuromusa kysingii TaxID=37625 RepID=A0A1H3XJY7_9BACT|nr:SIS domain-containing protein [Desulfuromusa kysingii]SDZ99570.1 D-sedoheptulose 7-phosphate isomerase [Desulfuromusa kysingii]